MRVQYMSDLHLEMIDNLDYLKTTEFKVGGEILVLAGDIIYLRDTIAVYNSFWDWAAKNYQQVLLVPGNHEFYGYDDVAKRGDSWQGNYVKTLATIKTKWLGLMTQTSSSALFGLIFRKKICLMCGAV